MLFRVFLLLFALVQGVYAEVCATDDVGHAVCLPAPAQRIATLSPGATELVFAAGAGDRIVAVVEYSNYPPAAQELPSVGNYKRIDMEALLALKPDLVITWVTGNPPEQVALLKELGIPQFAIEPRTLEGVSSALERLSVLAGTKQAGFAEAQRFRTGIAALSQQYRSATPVSVFYQVWGQPLMTINNEHLISKVLQLCGGVNVFGDMPRLVPRIGAEDVLKADPDAMFTGSAGGKPDDQLGRWKHYQELKAVANNHLFFVPASLISRPTPRILKAGKLICQQLDTAREQQVHPHE
jgi:iron complex transport system substrate-binding protein